MRLEAYRRRLLGVALAVLAVVAVQSVRGEEAPAVTSPTPEPTLHERIDALIDVAAIGPINPPANDADFLRRVSLDLTGLIPTAAEARAFLADDSPDKRAKLIEQLLASPHYARHMAQTFDVMLIERRADKVIKVTDWEEYLRQSFATNKPLDQLYREMVLADGAAEPVAAARFLMNRDCEPNAVTRDLGRMYFGMDLQCAQCHDHPLIDDYYQADYYGLFAFVLRSSLFADKAKKTTLIVEKGEGEANYKSVFTEDSADRVKPRLPKGMMVSFEPAFAKGQEYVVAPAANVRPVPKYSRRTQLADLLQESHEFRRNVANRLWAQMLGRGLVHPVDFHHPANPPSHPELLTLLADELAKRNFDSKAMLREIALTRVYQRSCDAPDPAKVNLPVAAEEIARLEAKRPELLAKVEERKVAAESAVNERKGLIDQAAALQSEIATLEASAKTADDAAAKATTEQKKLDDDAAKKKEAATLVTNAALRTSVAQKKLPEDKIVADAFKLLDDRAKALTGESDMAAKAAADLKPQTDAAVAAATAAAEAIAAALAKLPVEELKQRERALVDAQHGLADAKFAVAALDAQIETAKAIGDWQAKASDPALATPAWNTLVDRWTVAGNIGGLKGLTSEQLARSIMQATGALAKHQATAADGLARKPTDELKNASDADKPRLLAELTEVRAHNAMRSELTAFAGLYGTLQGEDFQATVNQALFFGNGSLVQGWLSPAGGNLAERLIKIESPAELADELYLSVLTRPATPEEKDDLAAYLHERTDDRQTAISELVWALVSSNEFRFNH